MGVGHGDKQSRQEEAALAALISCATIGDAAKQTGVNESTLRRWLQQPEFSARYREARQQVVRHAITRLQSATTAAVETLERNMGCGVPSTEVAAAKAVLEQAFKAAEFDDVMGRIEELERLAASRGGQGS